MGSSGFRVPGRNQKSGLQWVPGSESEPKKWVPVGSGFRVGTQKVGSNGFRVRGRHPKSGFQWVPGSDQIFFCADPWFSLCFWSKIHIVYVKIGKFQLSPCDNFNDVQLWQKCVAVISFLRNFLL